MIALIPVIGVVLVSLLVTRIATVILTTTGMSRENARFQARSALSGVGFTTAAAEAVVRHPVRRRVIFTLMLFGGGGLVTALASLIVSFGGHAAHRGARAGVLLGALFVIWLASRSQSADRLLSAVIARILHARGWVSKDYATLTRLAEGHAVGELQVREEDWLAGRTLRSLRLRDEGVDVLGLDRAGEYTSLPDGDCELLAGDTLYLYGAAELLESLDHRPRSQDGEQAHAAAAEDPAATK